MYMPYDRGVIFLARAQGSDMYQFAHIREGANPLKKWDDARVRVPLYETEGGSTVIVLLEHELRNYRTSTTWYKLPPDIAELIPYMVDVAVEANASRERERSNATHAKRMRYRKA